MGQPRRRYIPAAAYDWLLPLYDPLQRWLVREDSVKRPLIQGAEILPGHRVLDIGCGTATLTILIKRLHFEGVGFVWSGTAEGFHARAYLPQKGGLCQALPCHAMYM